MSKCCLMSHCLLIEIFVNADLEVAEQRSHDDARTDKRKMDHHFEEEDLKIEGNSGGRFVARF